MMDEMGLEVIARVYSDGGAFKLGCECKCFPLIGSQKRLISRGEYRSETQATENKFNSDLMSYIYARRLSPEPFPFLYSDVKIFPFLFVFTLLINVPCLTFIGLLLT